LYAERLSHINFGYSAGARGIESRPRGLRSRLARGGSMKQLLQNWVTQQAESRPDARGIVFGNESVTYAELDRRSNQLAHLLQESGCRKGDRVCILMPKSPDAILSMIGRLTAGCMHVPIDSASPAARIARILEACQSRCILAAGP